MSKRWDALSAKEVNGKTYWTKLGVMFENRSGNGYTLSLDAIPVPTDGAYRISLFEPKDNNNSGGGSNEREQSSNSSGRPGANRGQSSGGLEDDIPF